MVSVTCTPSRGFSAASTTVPRKSAVSAWAAGGLFGPAWAVRAEALSTTTRNRRYDFRDRHLIYAEIFRIIFPDIFSFLHLAIVKPVVAVKARYSYYFAG